jgi:putative Mg2+ transporter-C (MgtC) family protein
MDSFWLDAFELPSAQTAARAAIRLFIAALIGGCLGIEREREGMAAGLRTHMLVALGAALFALAPLEAGMSIGDVSRVFQGVATGVGFLGAGTILKLTQEREIKGLTTAASIWLTAAAGLAVGAGKIWLPAVATLLAYLILSVVGYIERRWRLAGSANQPR